MLMTRNMSPPGDKGAPWRSIAQPYQSRHLNRYDGLAKAGTGDARDRHEATPIPHSFWRLRVVATRGAGAAAGRSRDRLSGLWIAKRIRKPPRSISTRAWRKGLR